jgi:hypothetical protein
MQSTRTEIFEMRCLRFCVPEMKPGDGCDFPIQSLFYEVCARAMHAQ